MSRSINCGGIMLEENPFGAVLFFAALLSILKACF